MLSFSAPIPLTLYVHIPWCVRKCPYCDFNSHAANRPLPEQAYVEALLKDLEQDLPRVQGRVLQSIFIGGGTPSLFSVAAIAGLLAGLQERLVLAPDAEITLEANPGTVEQHRFCGYRELGINRLSIGVQSFNPEHLRRLGRIHDRDEAIHAVEAAFAAGFDNVNLDLMYALPGQALEQALADVNQAIALEPTHISLYQLTLEPNTLFHKHPPVLPDDEQTWTMQLRCQERLALAGYSQYEVSAYARAGRRCRHNLNYWEFGDYLGIGAGAHGKLTDTANGCITRLWKHKNPRDYLRQDSIGDCVDVAVEDLGLEFMMNALRLLEGFPSRLFQERTGLVLQRLTPCLHKAQTQGLLHWKDATLRPTELGTRFLNDLVALFMP